MTLPRSARLALACAAVAAWAAFGQAATGALAAGSGDHSHGHASGHGAAFGFGEPGKPAEAARTVEIEMHDSFYKPAELTVRAGETVRFVVLNKGALIHEFNIGTAAMHRAHQQEMAKMMHDGLIGADRIDHHKMQHAGMMHDDPNAVLLEPGQSGVVVWKFARAASVSFGCNVPGHYEAGMVGPIAIE